MQLGCRHAQEGAVFPLQGMTAAFNDNKKLLGAKGIARSKDATRGGSWPY